ncbi:MAG: pyruvate carboxylase subunit B, partial [Candidatus Hydrothermarchaeota archaeon]|nr:pyruvate carboxylase subunit B [Candidatus Hydrothermarchaeota archaeon]
ALGTSQPPTESIIAALRGTPYDTGIKLESLTEVTAYFKEVRKKYAGILDPISEIVDTNVLLYQIPGGMLSNLVSQLKEQNALDRYEEVLKETPKVRADLGYAPLVTPTSQIVGIQAVMNVLIGERYKVVSKEVKDYVKGLYGKPPAPISDDIRAKIIGEEKPITCRPADLIPPQYQLMKEEAEKLGIVKKEEDILTYALYPAIAPKFLKGGIKEEPLKLKEEVAPPPSAIPTIFKVEVDGESYDVKVEPVGGFVEIKESGSTIAVAQKVVDGGIVAPMQGMILKLKVKLGQAVKKGDIVAVLEAMKMQNDIFAPNGGVVKEIFVAEGAAVSPGTVLMVIK